MPDDKRDFKGVGDDAFGATDPDMEMKLGAELPFRGDVLEADLEAAQNEAASWREKALRATADLDNFRKRTARERDEERRRAGERIVSELLPVVDDIERAIEHADAEGGDRHLLHGVQAVHAKLLRVLESEGVRIIDPSGEPFDPHLHEAVGQREDAGVPEHTVVDVLRKGYELGGRVVRHAMVMVSTGGPEAGK
jgi:molecular chaperone GrpE